MNRTFALSNMSSSCVKTNVCTREAGYMRKTKAAIGMVIIGLLFRLCTIHEQQMIQKKGCCQSLLHALRSLLPQHPCLRGWRRSIKTRLDFFGMHRTNRLLGCNDDEGTRDNLI